jgi:hypothetical protein
MAKKDVMLELEILTITNYFNNQIYNMTIEEDLSDLIDMNIEQIRDCVFHFDNINYIIYSFCLAGAPKQQIQNDVNKFITYYVVSNMRREFLSDFIISSVNKKAFIAITKYRKINEEIFDLFIHFINTKIMDIIQKMESEEEFETCLNLQKSMKYMFDLKKSTEFRIM